MGTRDSSQILHQHDACSPSDALATLLKRNRLATGILRDLIKILHREAKYLHELASCLETEANRIGAPHEQSEPPSVLKEERVSRGIIDFRLAEG